MIGTGFIENLSENETQLLNAVDACSIHFESISFLILYDLDPYRLEIQRQILNFDRMHDFS
jgi:hypothetical protein